MAPNNRPRAREKKIIEGQGSVYRKGSGLDSKPLDRHVRQEEEAAEAVASASAR